MGALSSYDLWKTDPDRYGRQETWEAEQQRLEDESLEAAINDFNPERDLPMSTETLASPTDDQRALMWDALRWRLMQRGLTFNRNYEVDETESNVVAAFLGRNCVGYGRTVQDATDCALYLIGEHGDDVPFAALRSVWCRHFRSRYDGDRPGGQRWVKPPPMAFELSVDGRVCLREVGQ